MPSESTAPYLWKLSQFLTLILLWCIKLRRQEWLSFDPSMGLPFDSVLWTSEPSLAQAQSTIYQEGREDYLWPRDDYKC